MTQNSAALSIIVPTYNERDRLEHLVRAVFGTLQACRIAGEVVVVDDNSPDGTGALADRLAETYPLRVVHRAGKLGLGTAVIAGFGVASADLLGVMDADLSHPADAVPGMLAVLDSTGSDMVVGSRYIPGGGSKDWSALRSLMSMFACRLAAPITPVRDATSGFFIVRRPSIEGVEISAGGFKICLELLVRGRIRAVAEAPYVFVGRTAGESKMNVREALGYLVQLRDLLAVRWSTGAPPRPRYYRASVREMREAVQTASGRR
jgi:dolichol-phosphate mannosyltransferase